MKKVFSYTLVASMILAALTGCNEGKTKKDVNAQQQKPQVTVPAASAKQDAAKDQANAKKEEKPAAEAKAFDLGSPEKNYSYALGATIGDGLAGNIKTTAELGVNFDKDALKAGFADSLAGSNKMSKEDMQKHLSSLDESIRSKAEAKDKADNQKNLQEGKEFLAKNAKAEGVKVTASGLQYRVNVQGTGDKVTSNDDIVSVFYTGKLVNGKVFDSNETDGKKALEFPVGGVIQGWQEGLKLMTVGSDYDFFIPAELAYGEQKMPGNIIPPNSTLIFHVRLVGVKHADAKDGAAASAEQAPEAKAEDKAQQVKTEAAAAAEQVKTESAEAAKQAVEEGKNAAEASISAAAEEVKEVANDVKDSVKDAVKVQDSVKKLPDVDADAANL
ncbi:MAG: FKBP-type peptidyl-prolyl cis-trans isomerase [Succinivibrionaceae bacterium]|nr:FKBP-type peptidyl-prolyl cis-trans isomerase [Succinivibrionaceae bacterium]